MSISVTVIIAVLYLIVHIISAIAKESTRRKEEQIKREEAARRRGETGLLATASDVPATFDPMGTTRQPGPLPSPEPVPTVRRGSPKDDLAARRREQIEQLRNRRQARQGVPTATGARTPDPAMRIPDRSPAPADVLGQERRRRQEQEEAKARQARQARTKQREAEAKARKERERRERAFQEAVREDAVVEPSRPVVATKSSSATERTAGLRGPQVQDRVQLRARLSQPASLREVLILKEILDRPVSMRDATGG